MGFDQPCEVSILFTDLVGSARLYQERGDISARILVHKHELMLSDQVQHHTGTVVKTIGDSLLAIFKRPRKAFACAISMQQCLHRYNQVAPPADRLSIRIGLHHGEALLDARDLHGNAVNLAARIVAMAKGGEILSSATAWQRACALDTETEPLGDVEIQGIIEKVPLVRVLWDPAEIASFRTDQLERRIVPELVTALAAHRIAPVVGGADPAEGDRDMEAKIAGILAAELGIAGRGENAALSEVAALFEEEYDRRELLERVLQVVSSQPTRRSPFLQTLAGIPFDLVLTTAIHGELGRALEATGRTVRRFAGAEQVTFAGVQEGEVALVHLFGSLEHPESVAVTEQERAARLERLRYASEELSTALSTRRLLFVGHHWNGPLIRPLFDQLVAERDPTILKPLAFASRIGAQARSRWQRRGIELIWADEMSFLERLGEAQSRRAHSLERRQERQVARLVAGPQGWQAKRPYKFLSFFDEADEDIFFGREDDTRRFVGLISSRRLVVMHAASGTGKTSLLNAGIAPRLKREGYAVTCHRGYRELETEIREGVTRLLSESGLPTKATLPDGVMSTSLPTFLLRSAKLLGQPLVIILDQFEECFLWLPKKARASFAAQLGAILKSPDLPVRFVLALREDFLAKLCEFRPWIPDILASAYPLGSLTAKGMEDAIQEPARLAGLRFESGLVVKMIADLGAVEVETPQLQILCDRLYDEIEEGSREISLRHYERTGGVKGILGRYLERVLATRAADEASLLREVLKTMVTSIGTKGVASAEEIAAGLGRPVKAVNAALSSLTEARLLRALRGSSEITYELSHECLTDEIGQWIDEREREHKKARELLRQEVLNHQKFGMLMAPGRLEIISRFEDALRLTAEERELLKLSRKRHRRNRRCLVLGFLGALSAAVAGGVLLTREFKIGMCRGTARAWTGVWDASVKARIQDAWQSAGRSFSSDVFHRVEGNLDRYVEGWSRMSAESCHAANLDGRISAQLMDLRMRCLQEKLQKVKVLTEVWRENLDREVLDKAVQASLSLGKLEACVDDRALSAEKPLPEEPSRREKVIMVRGMLSRISALQTAGKFADGLLLAQQAREEATRIGYRPIQVVASYKLGELLGDVGRFTESEQALQQTLSLGRRERDAKTVADAYIYLIFLLGYYQAKPAEALALRPAAELAIDLSGGEEKQRAEYAHNLGAVLLNQGDPAAAIHSFEQALTIMEIVHGRDHPRVAVLLNNLGVALQRAGRTGEAIVRVQQSLAIYEKTLGETHPDVSASLDNLGFMLRSLGRAAEAKPYHERALALSEKTLGKEHPDVGGSLTRLGAVLLDLGRPDEARQHLERALAIREKSLGADHPDVAATLLLLAKATRCGPTGGSRALTLAKRAQVIYSAQRTAAKASEVEAWMKNPVCPRPSPSGAPP